MILFITIEGLNGPKMAIWIKKVSDDRGISLPGNIGRVVPILLAWSSARSIIMTAILVTWIVVGSGGQMTFTSSLSYLSAGIGSLAVSGIVVYNFLWPLNPTTPDPAQEP